MIKIITHPRHFHTDELMAITLLKVFVDSKIEIVRSRESTFLNEYKNNHDYYVVDVGFDYNPSMKNFDHHQKSFDKTWSDGIKYSSCGLVWDYLKNETAYLKSSLSEDLISLIEENIIKKIDAMDNGQHYYKELDFIRMYNRNVNNDKVMDIQFHRALKATIDFYHNSVSFFKNKDKECKLIIKTIKENEGKMCISFSRNISSLKDLVDTNFDIAILPHSKGKWIIKSIPSDKNNLFTKKISFPKSWAGLEGDELKNLTGISGLEFCHKELFMLIFNGDIKDAERLAEKIINSN